MTQSAIELKQVTRRFRRGTALDHISCSQETGRILGLVGLPGSGKTTLIYLIAGLDKPTAGHVRVLGGNPLQAPIRARISLASDPQLLDPSLTIEETLVYFSRLKGFSRKESNRISEQLLDELELGDKAALPVGELSNSSRLLVCAGVALIGDPELLLFDGSFDDLEDTDLSRLQSILRRRTTQGRTIVLAGRCFAVLGEICDEIALLHEGRLLAKATKEEICASVRGLLFKYLVQNAHPVTLDQEGIEVRFTGSATEVLCDHSVAEQLAHRFPADAVEEIQPTFEEACLWILRNPEAIAARSKLWSPKDS